MYSGIQYCRQSSLSHSQLTLGYYYFYYYHWEKEMHVYVDSASSKVTTVHMTHAADLCYSSCHTSLYGMSHKV